MTHDQALRDWLTGHRLHAVEQRAEQLERTRESEAQRAVVEERNRIAREITTSSRMRSA